MCSHLGFSPYVLQLGKEEIEGFVSMTKPPQPNSVAAVILCYFVSSFRLIINKKHFVTIIFKSVIYIRLLHQKIRKQAFFGLFLFHSFKNQFFGNIAAGTESSADFTIQTANAGTLNGLLTVTYEDEKGNAKTLTKEFSMTVEEMQMGGDDTMGGGMDTMVPMEPEPTGVPVWVWIVVGVGVVAAVVVVLVVLKKKKAKRRAAQLMEDDDEDI